MNRKKTERKGNHTCKEMQTPYKNYNLTFSEENGSSVHLCVARWLCTHPSQNDSHSADLCLSGSPRQHCGGGCSRMVVGGWPRCHSMLIKKEQVVMETRSAHGTEWCSKSDGKLENCLTGQSHMRTAAHWFLEFARVLCITGVWAAV